MKSTTTHLAAIAAATLGLLAQSSCTKYSISGAVARPGEYSSFKAITVNEAIHKVGGLTADADPTMVYLDHGYFGSMPSLESIGSRKLESGMEITIPTIAENLETRRLHQRGAPPPATVPICSLHKIPFTVADGYEVDGPFSTFGNDAASERLRSRKAPNSILRSQSLKKHWIYTEPAKLSYCSMCQKALEGLLAKDRD